MPFVGPPLSIAVDLSMASGPFVMKFVGEAEKDLVNGDAAAASGYSEAGVCYHVTNIIKY
jgi:hypothetical protein